MKIAAGPLALLLALLCAATAARAEDRDQVERRLQSVGTLFAQYVAGYVGSSVERRGKNAEQDAVWSMVELQALQTGIELVHQVVTRLTAGIDNLVFHHAIGLGGDHQFIAREPQLPDRLAGDGFRLTQPIDIGCVEEVDAGVESLLDQRGGGFLRQSADHLPQARGSAKRHRAHAQL